MHCSSAAVLATTQRKSPTFVARTDPLLSRWSLSSARLAQALNVYLRSEPIEQSIFWLFIAGLAWVPYWYGSNDWIAWGINAVVFAGLAAFYELALVLRGKPHPIALRHVALPAALYGSVVAWVGLQSVAWFHGWPGNSIWGLTANTLGDPVKGSISVNPDLTAIALLRLATAASVFWLGVQLCRSAKRANLLISAVGAIGVAYAVYGFAAMKFGQLPWLPYLPADKKNLSATFINPDSFATYAAIALISVAALLLRYYGDGMRAAAGNYRLQIAFLIERTGRYGAALVAAGFIVLVALLMTGSRGGVMAAILGLLVLGGIIHQRRERTRTPVLLLVIGLALIGVTLVAFGQAIDVKLAEGGIYDENRFSVYLLMIRSIINEPLLGYGYGTFPDVFPMYRDHSLGVLGTWGQAHDTYLEVFQGLGLIFGTMLIGCVALLVVRCVKGAMTRQHDITTPAVAVGAATVVATHALVDFSLQMQAIALTFMAILGAGAAQSMSTRLVLDD